MKRVFSSAIVATLLLVSSNLSAQSIKESFSAEGRAAWKPEFTARNNLGFFASGFVATGGVRIDERRTLGLMMGKNENIYTVNHGYADVNSFSAALYGRSYFHIGKRKIFSLYSDLALGAAVVTGIEGGYWVDQENVATIKDDIDVERGDVQPYFSWQPGMRVRFYKNIHLFLGPTLSTHCLGVHLGLGF